MLLLGKNATITVCHTRTVNLAEECRKAEVLVAAAGKAKMITGDMVGEAAVVVGTTSVLAKHVVKSAKYLYGLA